MATFGRQKIGDERFVERTGRSMREWARILDRWGAREKGHTATARYLEKNVGLDGWWSQAVTIQYEDAKGLRKPLTVPAELRRALSASPKARDAFAELSPSHKREYIQWINEGRRPETRARRVNETVRKLTG